MRKNLMKHESLSGGTLESRQYPRFSLSGIPTRMYQVSRYGEHYQDGEL